MPFKLLLHSERQSHGFGLSVNGRWSQKGGEKGEGGTLKLAEAREVSVNQSTALMFSFNPINRSLAMLQKQGLDEKPAVITQTKLASG